MLAIISTPAADTVPALTVGLLPLRPARRPGRENHTAVWTGNRMIVWGGFANGVGYENTGGRYNPGTDSWTATSIANAPTGRELHTAVWAGGEMIVWGGRDNPSYFNTGGKYNPSTDSWAAISITNAPAARADHTAVWTGSEMIVWGGIGNTAFGNTGGRYCAAAPAPQILYNQYNNAGTDATVSATFSDSSPH